VPDRRESDTGVEVPSDLARLVDAIGQCPGGDRPPRKPRSEPLPTQLDLAELAFQNGSGAVALADEPRRQTQYPVGGNLDDGNLLLFGIPGSGTTTALASLVLSLSPRLAPEQLEVYAIDNGADSLRSLYGHWTQEVPQIQGGPPAAAADRL
jgi:S-DNA-T family DNA segregation ATPase FtsK/SpoIIIE